MSPQATATMKPASTPFAWPRALAACLCMSMLSGCCWGMNRCGTWDRVTHPDYMYPEDTLLHGYHRTTWEAWPAQNCVVQWDTAEAASEAVPSGAPQRELPTPAEAPARATPKATPDAGTPASTDEGFVPQAAKPRRQASDWNLHRLRAEAKLRANQAAQRRRTEYASAVEAAANVLLNSSAPIQQPLVATPVQAPLAVQVDALDGDLDTSDAFATTSDAAFTSRFATLINRDRKASWKKLNAADLVAEVNQSGNHEVRQVIPVAHHVVERESISEELSLPMTDPQQEDASTQLAPAGGPAAPIEDPATPPAPKGDGEIRLKLKPAT